MKRVSKKIVSIGNVSIGGENKIAIQSMTNAKKTEDIINQIKELETAGCEIIRVAVPDFEMASEIKKIKAAINIPLVADIHFDYRLAIESIKNGVDKIRINPGNIGSVDRVKMVVDTAKAYHIPIRIGVNSGSLEKNILAKYGKVTADGIAESAMKNVSLLNDLDFDDIVLSAKCSDVQMCVDTYLKLSKTSNYPLHIGVTETGAMYSGIVKSSVGLGTLLMQGIGDTIRVSLTGNPVEEIKCAKEILKCLNLREFGIEIISCPTCGRTQIDLINIVDKVQEKCKDIDKKIKVAVMGCAVNGPGEAREADIGIAGGKGVGIIFRHGKIIKRVKEEMLVDELLEEIKKI